MGATGTPPGLGLGDGDGVEVGPEVVELSLVPAGRVDSTTQAQRTHIKVGTMGGVLWCFRISTPVHTLHTATTPVLKTYLNGRAS